MTTNPAQNFTHITVLRFGADSKPVPAADSVTV
jgi:hypothetical protein